MHGRYRYKCRPYNKHVYSPISLVYKGLLPVIVSLSGNRHTHSVRFIYTAKLLFHHSPIRHSDYTVTTTVTMQSPFSSSQHRYYWTVNTQDTSVIRYPLPWCLCSNLCIRHLVSKCMVTTWEDTRYQLHTVTVQE